MLFGGIINLYIALMSFKYNMASIYSFMLVCQHHIKAGHLLLIVLICHLNLNLSIHDAVK